MTRLVDYIVILPKGVNVRLFDGSLVPICKWYIACIGMSDTLKRGNWLLTVDCPPLIWRIVLTSPFWGGSFGLVWSCSKDGPVLWRGRSTTTSLLRAESSNWLFCDVREKVGTIYCLIACMDGSLVILWRTYNKYFLWCAWEISVRRSGHMDKVLSSDYWLSLMLKFLSCNLIWSLYLIIH